MMNIVLLFCLTLIFFFFSVSFLKFANILAKCYVDSCHRVNNCLVCSCMNKLAKLSLGTRN